MDFKCIVCHWMGSLNLLCVAFPIHKMWTDTMNHSYSIVFAIWYADSFQMRWSGERTTHGFKFPIYCYMKHQFSTKRESNSDLCSFKVFIMASSRGNPFLSVRRRMSAWIALCKGLPISLTQNWSMSLYLFMNSTLSLCNICSLATLRASSSDMSSSSINSDTFRWNKGLCSFHRHRSVRHRQPSLPPLILRLRIQFPHLPKCGCSYRVCLQIQSLCTTVLFFHRQIYWLGDAVHQVLIILNLRRVTRVVLLLLSDKRLVVFRNVPGTFGEPESQFAVDRVDSWRGSDTDYLSSWFCFLCLYWISFAWCMRYSDFCDGHLPRIIHTRLCSPWHLSSGRQWWQNVRSCGFKNVSLFKLSGNPCINSKWGTRSFNSSYKGCHRL